MRRYGAFGAGMIAATSSFSSEWGSAGWAMAPLLSASDFVLAGDRAAAVGRVRFCIQVARRGYSRVASLLTLWVFHG